MRALRNVAFLALLASFQFGRHFFLAWAYLRRRLKLRESPRVKVSSFTFSLGHGANAGGIGRAFIGIGFPIAAANGAVITRADLWTHAANTGGRLLRRTYLQFRGGNILEVRCKTAPAQPSCRRNNVRLLWEPR